MDAKKTIKLAIYENLDMMNSCCHNKNKQFFTVWSFDNCRTKKYCHEQTVDTSGDYTSSWYHNDKTCDSCLCFKKKLDELFAELDRIGN